MQERKINGEKEASEIIIKQLNTNPKQEHQPAIDSRERSQWRKRTTSNRNFFFFFFFRFFRVLFGLDIGNCKMKEGSNNNHRATNDKCYIVFPSIIFQKAYNRANAYTIINVKLLLKDKPAAGGPIIDVAPRKRKRMPKALVNFSRPTQSSTTLGISDIWGARRDLRSLWMVTDHLSYPVWSHRNQRRVHTWWSCRHTKREWSAHPSGRVRYCALSEDRGQGSSQSVLPRIDRWYWRILNEHGLDYESDRGEDCLPKMVKRNEAVVWFTCRSSTANDTRHMIGK